MINIRKGETTMTVAIITFFVGVFLGITIASLCTAASNRDDITYKEDVSQDVLSNRQI